MSILRWIFLICLLVPTSLFAQPGPNHALVRVVYSGAGLCCLVKMPGNRFVIYDAGNYADGGSLTFNKVQEIIALNSDIELMVLSHSDSDHLGAVDEICANYDVKRVLRPGYKRDSAMCRDAVDGVDVIIGSNGSITVQYRSP